MKKFNETIKRENCAICGSASMLEVRSVPGMPIYMGVSDVEGADDEFYSDITYLQCSSCKTIQIQDLIPLDILYSRNHNIDTVGKKWDEHFTKFSEFISKHADVYNVIEVGDPSAKIARRCLHQKWTIVEPNPHVENIPDTVTFIRAMLEDVQGGTYSAAVLSHVLEHASDPTAMLTKVKELLSPGGRIFISIPNFMNFAENTLMPPLGMHFEHSIFLDVTRAQHVLSSAGFRILERAGYDDHSIFIVAEVCDQKTEVVTEFYDPLPALERTFDKYTKIADKINRNIDCSRPAFLYGAHVMTQFLIAIGTDPGKFQVVLDGAKSKIGKRLYGTRLMVAMPEAVLEIKNPQVVCHMGPYTDEICDNLRRINEGCQIL